MAFFKTSYVQQKSSSYLDRRGMRKPTAEWPRDVLFQLSFAFQPVGCSHGGPRNEITILRPALEDEIQRFVNAPLAGHQAVPAEPVVRSAEERDSATLRLAEPSLVRTIGKVLTASSISSQTALTASDGWANGP